MPSRAAASAPEAEDAGAALLPVAKERKTAPIELARAVSEPIGHRRHRRPARRQGEDSRSELRRLEVGGPVGQPLLECLFKPAPPDR